MVYLNLEKEPIDDQHEREAFVKAILSTDLPAHRMRDKTRDPKTQMDISLVHKMKVSYDSLRPSHPGELHLHLFASLWGQVPQISGHSGSR